MFAKLNDIIIYINIRNNGKVIKESSKKLDYENMFVQLV